MFQIFSEFYLLLSFILTDIPVHYNQNRSCLSFVIWQYPSLSLINFPYFLHHLCKFLIFPGDISVILSFMRKHAVGAVFDSFVPYIWNFLQALSPLCTQRAVTEQAVKVIRVCTFMTRKELCSSYDWKKNILFLSQ